MQYSQGAGRPTPQNDDQQEIHVCLLLFLADSDHLQVGHHRMRFQ